MFPRYRKVFIPTHITLLLLVLAATFQLAVPRPATASMQQIPFDVAVRSADAIVIAIVAGAHSAFTADGGRIDTFVELTATRVLKGSLSAHYVVRVGGGQVGDVRMSQEDEPVLQEGETVLLLLQADGSEFVCVGGFQGKFEVRDGIVLQQDTLLGPLSAVVTTINSIMAGSGGVR